jgi:hypothetical protein
MHALEIIRRITQRVLSVAALVLLVAVVALGTAAYLTASGSDLRLLKLASARLGVLFAGQRTDALRIDAELDPDTSRLSARARLTMRSVEDQRRRLYFLLNDGLTLRRAQVAGGESAARVFRLWLVTVVDLGRPLRRDETVEVELDYEGNPLRGGLGAGGALFDARDVLLPVDAFWYPSDVQSFFSAEVAVSLPARMTLVHNGRELARAHYGNRQRVTFRSERPIGGLSLVAGPYQLAASTARDLPLQFYTADDVDLDGQTAVQDMADAHAALARRFGPSGFPRLTMFVTRRLRRAFNDGSGLMGMGLRYYRRGDYGFHTVAHEIAHNWWGGTVAEKWLTPGTGGEWIVEGFAEFSSLLATEEHWGRDALTRRLHDEFFDPARQRAVADMSVLDNFLSEATARDTIYKKGAYVALMLRSLLGDDVLQAGLRQFLERFRHQQATDGDLEATLRDSSGRDLSAFFADWVRSDKLADLALEPLAPTQLNVMNRGPAGIPGSIPLWLFPGDGAAAEPRMAEIGETVALPSAATVAVLDPQGLWADMRRFNNRAPRVAAPRFVTASGRGDVLLTTGEPHPGAPASVVLRAADGTTRHQWEFERGVIDAPQWSADGARIVVSAPNEQGEWPAIITLNPADGSQTAIGAGVSPAFGAGNAVIAARGDRLVRFDGTRRVELLRHRRWTVETAVPAPSGRRIAYVAGRDSRLDLRLCDEQGGNDRSLLTWDRDRVLVRWAPDESRLYAVIGGNWDWQVWDVPVDRSGVRVLVSEAAAIRDLAVSADGQRLAFAAAPLLTRPFNPQRLYVLDVATGRASAPDASAADIWQLAWETPSTLLAVTASNETPLVMPQPRTARRIRLSDSNDGNWEALDSSP